MDITVLETTILKKEICSIDNSRSGMTQLGSEPYGRAIQIIQSEKQRE